MVKSAGTVKKWEGFSLFPEQLHTAYFLKKITFLIILVISSGKHRIEEEGKKREDLIITRT